MYGVNNAIITLLFVGTTQLGIVLKELPNFTQWDTLGLNLGIVQGKLDQIDADSRNVSNRVSKVIQEWLKRNHNEEEYGPPTWNNLVKAVKPIDKELALDIEAKYCTSRGKNNLRTNTCVPIYQKGFISKYSFFVFQMIT